MTLTEIINLMCTKNGALIPESEYAKNAYMLRTVFSAKYPLQADALNKLCLDPETVSRIIILICSQMNSTPNEFKSFVSIKKKTLDIYSKYDTNVIEKACEVEQTSPNVLQEAYNTNRKEVEDFFETIVETFFPKDEKIKKEKIK